MGPLASLALGPTGVLLEVNAAASMLLDRPASALVGHPLAAVATFEDDGQPFGLLRAALETGSAQGELRITTRSERRLRLKLFCTTERHADGELTLRAAALDVSERDAVDDVTATLLGACAAVARATSPAELLSDAARALVAGLVDACVIDMVSAHGLDPAAHVAHTDARLEQGLRELERDGVPGPLRDAVVAAIGTRRAQRARAVAPIRPGVWLVVPVVVKERVAAVLRLGRARAEDELDGTTILALEGVGRAVGAALERLDADAARASAARLHTAALRAAARDLERPARELLCAAGEVDDDARPLARTLRATSRTLAALADQLDEVARLDGAPSEADELPLRPLVREALAELPPWVDVRVRLEVDDRVRVRGARAPIVRALAALLRHTQVPTRVDLHGWHEGAATLRLSIDAAATPDDSLRVTPIDARGASAVLARALLESQGGSVWISGTSIQLALPCVHAR